MEGGYGTVAIEWGMLGLVLWILWSVAWIREQSRRILQARGSPWAGVGLVLVAYAVYYLFFWFFAGMQQFQDYIGNAYFWLFSGMIFGVTVTVNLRDAVQRTLDWNRRMLGDPTPVAAL